MPELRWVVVGTLQGTPPVPLDKGVSGDSIPNREIYRKRHR